MNTPQTPYPWALKELYFEEVKKLGGQMVNCHAHLDRAYTATPEIILQANSLMERKWILMRDIKKAYCENPQELEDRLSKVVDYFLEQGITACRTHIDCDPFVGEVPMITAAKVREKVKDRFTLQLVSHPLEGFFTEDFSAIDQNKVDLFEKLSDIADVIGGLPSKDRPAQNGPTRHTDILYSIAKNQGKDLDIHTDQENNPEEKDIDWLMDKVEEHNYAGHYTAVHCISLACRPKNERQELYKRMVDLGVSVSCSPRAAIGMKQHNDKIAPIHNSITPVDELLEAGVTVGIGTDNISDIFIPESSGNLWEEVNLLSCAIRIYDPEKLAKIAVTNGQKLLKLIE